MDDTKVTAEEIKAMLAGDIDALAEEMAAAMNDAKAGRIIADSEESVRDAHREFRQQAYEKVISLLQAKQEAFSPSAQRAPHQGGQAGDASDGQRLDND
jgi:predicted TIM-barrel fold metal-dependent hydrolase